eukprot:m51a1_g14606 hypothetical protein (110) ;mRNA; f:1195525-1195854
MSAKQLQLQQQQLPLLTDPAQQPRQQSTSPLLGKLEDRVAARPAVPSVSVVSIVPVARRAAKKKRPLQAAGSPAPKQQRTEQPLSAALSCLAAYSDSDSEGQGQGGHKD